MGIKRLPDEFALLTQIQSLSMQWNSGANLDVLEQMPNLQRFWRYMRTTPAT